MAYYPVDGIEDKLAGFANRLRVMCSIYSLVLFDEYKKIVLLMYLAEYITIKSRNSSQIHDKSYYIPHSDVINNYDMDMRSAVGPVLYARDWVCHEPDTPRQIRSWKRIWDNGLVEKVPKYEGFM